MIPVSLSFAPEVDTGYLIHIMSLRLRHPTLPESLQQPCTDKARQHLLQTLLSVTIE